MRKSDSQEKLDPDWSGLGLCGDLLVMRGNTRRVFEVKRTTVPEISKLMRIALADLSLDNLDVIHAGPHTFPLGERVRAVAATRILEDIAPV